MSHRLRDYNVKTHVSGSFNMIRIVFHGSKTIRTSSYRLALKPPILAIVELLCNM